MLAKEFKNQFTCLEENAEKYMIFTVPTEKEVTTIDRNSKKHQYQKKKTFTVT